VAAIRLEQLTKVFPDGTRAVSETDLDVPDGQLLVLVGPSGCGKTTLLRMVAGLEQPTAGMIRIGTQIVNEVPPKKRDVAMVFQNYALYPHMNAFDNMAFALRRRGTSRAEIERRVNEAAQLLGLGRQLTKKPAALSGGQRQRVAMGRAIVRQPQAFLMDEPLSNLDAKLRAEMRVEISRIQRELGVTTIFVTHDQTEAMTLGDLVAVMRGGEVQQVAPPAELFAKPRNLFVAGFVGSPAMNLAQAQIERREGGISVRVGNRAVPLGEQLLRCRPALGALEGRPVLLGIRPEDIEDARFVPEARADWHLEATVELREDLGRNAHVHFTLEAAPAVTQETRELRAEMDAIAVEQLERQASEERVRWVASVNAGTPASEGDSIKLALDPNLFYFFDPASGDAV
jgi:multiple sugar transport system ATP-binding protein